MRQVISLVVVFFVLASSAHAAEGQGYFSLGGTVNRSDGLIEVSVPFMPHVALEGAFPISGGPFSAGYELSALFYRNHTTRWGSETGFGFLAGPVASLNVNERWTLSVSGGIILSNPYSDGASGDYLPGNEGVPAAQFVRDPLQRWYGGGAVRYQPGRSLAFKFGVRNTSPYVSVGWLF